MHPVLAELCRVSSIPDMRPDFFRRMQRQLRDDVQPLLDQRDTLEAENVALKARLAEIDAMPRRGRKPAEATAVGGE